jgi:hypothetical protein
VEGTMTWLQEGEMVESKGDCVSRMSHPACSVIRSPGFIRVVNQVQVAPLANQAGSVSGIPAALPPTVTPAAIYAVLGV